MRVNWCASCGNAANFGDQLTPALLLHFGVPCVWAPPPRSQLVVVGSILSKFPNSWPGTILGTGFIQTGLRRRFIRARILAVRGDLTRVALGLPRGVTLGDPGLLAPDLTPVERGDRTLIVPHFVDRSMAGRHPDAELLDIRTEPLAFIRAIARADLVYTSSLHAMIAADALGIRHVLEPHGQVKGGLFKFTDYGSALGETIRPYVVRLSSRESVARTQAKLRAKFGVLTGGRIVDPIEDVAIRAAH